MGTPFSGGVAVTVPFVAGRADGAAGDDCAEPPPYAGAGGCSGLCCGWGLPVGDSGGVVATCDMVGATKTPNTTQKQNLGLADDR